MTKPIVSVMILSLTTLIVLINLISWITKPIGVAVVHWQAPVKFDDSSALNRSEIEGYQIRWSNLDQSVKGSATVPGNTHLFKIQGLAAERYDISVYSKSIYGTTSEEAKTSFTVKYNI